MKNVKFLTGALALAMFVSCNDQNEDVAQEAAIKTTDVLATMTTASSKAGVASKDVNRPGSVLDWIDTIDISAETTTTNGGNNNYYITEDSYTMVDDGSGDANFVLEDVALGDNIFKAKGWSYNQEGLMKFGGINSNDPVAVLAGLRNEVPNANFLGMDQQVIYENPAAGQNVVNFDMKAESGRIMLVFALTPEVQNTLDTQNIYVSGSVIDPYGNTIGTFWNYWGMYGRTDNVMTFYWSDNATSIEGASVHFSIDVVDGHVPYYPVTNSFESSYTITNGVSVGCVYTIGADYVSEDVSDFNFTFNWTETDCDDCEAGGVDGIEVDTDLDPEVSTVDPCDIPQGVLSLVARDYSADRTVTVIPGTSTLELSNGTGTNTVFVINGTEYLISAKSQYQLKVPSNADVTWQILNATSPQRPVIHEGTILASELTDCEQI